MAWNQNPFAVDYNPPTGWATTQVARTYGDLKNANLWDWQQAQKEKGLTPSSGGSAWSPSFGYNTPRTYSPGSASSYGIQTIDLNPVGAEAVRAAIGKAGQLIGSTGQPLLSSQVKSPELQRQISGQMGSWMSGSAEGRAAQSAQRQRLSDFTNDYLSGGAKQSQLTAEESAAIAPVYTGGFEASLRKPLNAFNLASDEEYQRALGQIGRGVKDQAFLGQGEYGLARGYDAAKDLAIARAKERAAMESAIPGMVLQAQMAALGRRSAAEEANQRRALLPYDLENQLIAQEAALRGQDIGQFVNLANLWAGNQYYEAPENQLSRQIALLGQAGQTQPIFSMLGYNAPDVPVYYPRRSALLPAPTPSSFESPYWGQGLMMDASTGQVAQNYFPQTETNIPPGQLPWSDPRRMAFEVARSRFENPEAWPAATARYTPSPGGTGWGLGGFYSGGQLIPTEDWQDQWSYPTA